jgi:glutamate carboxypeptidase
MIALPISYFTDRTPQLLANLKEHVEAESPSTDKAAVDRYGAIITRQLRALKAEVEIDQQTTAGNHIIGRWGAGKGGFLIMCHTDTVHNIGAIHTNPIRQADGKFYGPGTQDMKASVVQTLAALQALIENKKMPPRPITALFTSDEEIGSDTSRLLIESLAKESSLVLCMEPAIPDGSLKTWRKGTGNFDVTIRGRSTHAGADHEGGVNAIEEAANQILALQRLTNYKTGTTVNVGVVKGGTRPNVVPDDCLIEVDIRVLTPAEAASTYAAITSLKPFNSKARVTVSGGLNRPPMPRTALIAQAFTQAQHIADSLGLAITEGGTGGASDANFVAPLNIPVLDGLGPIGNGAHSEREHIVIKSFPERTALLAAILSQWT